MSIAGERNAASIADALLPVRERAAALAGHEPEELRGARTQ